MKIRLIRHATVLLSVNNLKILLDPIFSPQGSRPPISNSPNPRANPLVDLPLSPGELTDLLQSLDALLLTHTHQDHFDELAQELIPKDTPILCQPEDEEKLQQLGFSTVYSIQDKLSYGGIDFLRTQCQHGWGEVGERMAPASGYLLQCPGEPSLYISGDTIWCPEAERALELYQPQLALLFAGAAQFLEGGPITMTGEDIIQVCRKAPKSKVIAVHLDSFNHCLLTRKDLKTFLIEKGFLNQVIIPEDGEEVIFN